MMKRGARNGYNGVNPPGFTKARRDNLRDGTDLDSRDGSCRSGGPANVHRVDPMGVSIRNMLLSQSTSRFRDRSPLRSAHIDGRAGRGGAETGKQQAGGTIERDALLTQRVSFNRSWQTARF